MQTSLKISICFGAFALLASCSASRPYVDEVHSVFPAETTTTDTGTFDSGFAWQNGVEITRNYEASRDAYIRASANGDARAENNLGVMAARGDGGRADYKAAITHFRKAAEMGSSSARYNLGVAYRKGMGVAPDPIAASTEFRISSDMGYAPASRTLADMLAAGEGLRRNPSEAKRLYEVAALAGDKIARQRLKTMGMEGLYENGGLPGEISVEHCGTCESGPEKKMTVRGYEGLKAMADKGDPVASYNLAIMKMNGSGTAADVSEAVRLLTISARSGYAPAERQLAQMHLRGDHVARSKVIAHAWLNLAAKQEGYEAASAREEMEKLEITMTPDEIAQAQAVAHQWEKKGR